MATPHGKEAKMSTKDTTPTAEILAFAPSRAELDSTHEKLRHVLRQARLTVEAMAEVGADFARYKAEHRQAYGDRPDKGLGFDEWVGQTFQVSHMTVRRWILLHENRHRIEGATSLRQALAMLRDGSPTSGSDSSHVLGDGSLTSGSDSSHVLADPPASSPIPPTDEVFADLETAEGVVSAKRQENQRKAERKEVAALMEGLGITEEAAWAYVIRKRKPLQPHRPPVLPSGWRRVSIPLTKEHSEVIAEAVSQAAKLTRRKPHKLYEECVVELGLEAFRKKYSV